LADEHIVTPWAARRGKRPDDDADPDSHGTCVTGKALGQIFRVTKKAALVVVRMRKKDGKEVASAFDLIADDIRAHPERQKRSVAFVSMGGVNLSSWV